MDTEDDWDDTQIATGILVVRAQDAVRATIIAAVKAGYNGRQIRRLALALEQLQAFTRRDVPLGSAEDTDAFVRWWLTRDVDDTA